MLLLLFTSFHVYNIDDHHPTTSITVRIALQASSCTELGLHDRYVSVDDFARHELHSFNIKCLYY